MYRIYQECGVDVESALERLSHVSISIHCWQGDDVSGFEGTTLSGGIAATGNYPGKARNAKELMSDIDMALKLIPGKHRINLHAIYAITDEKVHRSDLEPKHFKEWVQFAKERGLGLDFNPTLFSHEKVVDGLTLSSPKQEVRDYWIKHCKATRKIASYIGAELGSPCLHNIWIPDGYKDIPADRTSPRKRLKNSLDEIYSEKLENIIDAVESKLFGIGIEAYTVGSHEFYMGYALKNDILCLLDSGHFHPTELVSDKISSMLMFADKLALHVTRGIRWDSDHVVRLDEELKEIAKEIEPYLDRVLIGLDYFDASINRIAAWVIGVRNVQKALLYALLTPATLKEYQEKGEFTKIITMQEELKTYPFYEVWDEFCRRNNVPVRDWLRYVEEYEKENLRTQ